jgi:hypothetical protein
MHDTRAMTERVKEVAAGLYPIGRGIDGSMEERGY